MCPDREVPLCFILTGQDDVHNVPRKTGLSDQEQVFMSSPDDSTPTPPALLYDVPRALKEVSYTCTHPLTLSLS